MSKWLTKIIFVRISGDPHPNCLNFVSRLYLNNVSKGFNLSTVSITDFPIYGNVRLHHHLFFLGSCTNLLFIFKPYKTKFLWFVVVTFAILPHSLSRVNSVSVINNFCNSIAKSNYNTLFFFKSNAVREVFCFFLHFPILLNYVETTLTYFSLVSTLWQSLTKILLNIFLFLSFKGFAHFQPYL